MDKIQGSGTEIAVAYRTTESKETTELAYIADPNLIAGKIKANQENAEITERRRLQNSETLT